MIARWAFAPVCGFDYWRVIVTSPEVLIFLFFMITDPKTVPSGRVGRVVFGFLVAVASTLLMAPQTNEFGTKVALLGGLVVVCACRPLLDRLVPRHGRPTTGSPAHGAARDRSRPCRSRRRSFGRRSSRSSAVVGRRHRRRRRSGPRRRRPRRGRRAGPRAPRRRPGHVPHDHGRAGRARLEPRDHRRGRAGDRADAGREPRARERRRCSAPTRRSSRRSTTATGSTRCRRGCSDDAANGTTVVERYQIDDVNVTPARALRQAGRA